MVWVFFFIRLADTEYFSNNISYKIEKMINTKNFATFFLMFAGFLLFSPSAHADCSGELGSSDPIPSVWTKECSPYVIKTSITATGPVTIEPGVIVKFKKNAFATFQGLITAIGTEEEKIVFTAYTDDEHGGDTDGDLGAKPPAEGYWYRILIGPSSVAQFEHTMFLYGGEHPWGVLSTMSRIENSVSVKNSEFKHNKYAGIYLDNNPNQMIDDNVFSDNEYGVELGDCDHNITLEIKNNSFSGNTFGARVDYPNYNKIDARQNWWGDKTGPTYVDNPGGKGDRISKGVLFDPWIGKDPPDPVIIIPGIMGSWKKDGIWQIDPIFHIYDNLREEFLANEYEDGEDGGNFFTFPYEWRDSNTVNAVELKAKIQEIKNQTGKPKVDIVAHSMGGLLARAYIESDYYDDDVDQLITIGTPHLGAPKDYIKWEAGESFFDFFDTAAKRIFALEALEEGFNGNVFRYIQERPIESVKELLPVYNYIYDIENDDKVLRESYPVNYPSNEFLETLNKQENIKLLDNIDFTKIIGKENDDSSTIAGFNVVESNDEILWKEGYPKNFNFPLLWREGVNFSDGDKTVPLVSAEAEEIPADDKIYLESEHNALPTDAQKDILKILTGHPPAGEVRKWHVPSLLLTLVHSPVDIQIEDPLGRKIGKDFGHGGEIIDPELAEKGAFYTGYNTNTEFITVPNPEPGTYKILTQATGNGGLYRIETARIEEDKSDPSSAKESATIIGGIAEVGEDPQQATIEMTSSAVIDDIPPTVLEITSEKPDGFYKAGENISVNLEFSEPVTGQGQVSFNSGGSCQFTVDNSEKSSCNYIVQDGENTPDLGSSAIAGEIKDQAANAMTDYAPKKKLADGKNIIVDTSPPEIAISSPEEKSYNNDQMLLIDFNTADLPSGIADENWQVEKDGQKLNWVERNVDLSLEHLGNYTFKVTATDNAGNSKVEERQFRLLSSLKAIQNNIDHYWKLNLINKKPAKTYLEIQLEQLEKIFAALEKLEESNLKPPVKRLLINATKFIINHDVNQLIKHVEKKTPEWIDEKAAGALIESLGSIKI